MSDARRICKPDAAKSGCSRTAILNFLRRCTGQNQHFDMFQQFWGKRCKTDALIRAARNDNHFLVECTQTGNDARRAGGDGIVEPLHTIQRAHRLNAMFHPWKVLAQRGCRKRPLPPTRRRQQPAHFPNCVRRAKLPRFCGESALQYRLLPCTTCRQHAKNAPFSTSEKRVNQQ